MVAPGPLVPAQYGFGMRLVRQPIDVTRRRIAGEVRRMLAGSADAQRAPSVREPGDEGLFGRESSAWIVHSDLSSLVGGIRALLLQTLHPPTMAGVADHSSYRDDPLGRLQRTGSFLGRTVFGPTDDAEMAIAQVRAIHDRVTGTTPGGEPYAANDPHLLTWVHVTEVQSFLAAHQRYGSVRLSGDDADRYVAEMATVGLRLGMLDAPLTVAELDAVVESYRPELRIDAQARDAIRFLMMPPLSFVARGPYVLLLGAATALLPRWARMKLRLPLAPGVDPLLIRPAATVLLRTLGWALGASAAPPDAVGDGDDAAADMPRTTSSR